MYNYPLNATKLAAHATYPTSFISSFGLFFLYFSSKGVHAGEKNLLHIATVIQNQVQPWEQTEQDSVNVTYLKMDSTRVFGSWNLRKTRKTRTRMRGRGHRKIDQYEYCATVLVSSNICEHTQTCIRSIANCLVQVLIQNCAVVVFLTTNYMFCFLYCGTLLMSVSTVTLSDIVRCPWSLLILCHLNHFRW